MTERCRVAGGRGRFGTRREPVLGGLASASMPQTVPNRPRPPTPQHQRFAPPNGCAPANHCMLRSAARPRLQVSESRSGRVLSCHAHSATLHFTRARRCRTQNLPLPQTIFPRVATIRVNTLSLGFFSSQTSPARSSCPADVTACHCLPGVMPYECCRSG